MSIFVRFGFYLDVIPKSYRDFNNSLIEDITNFLSRSLTPKLNVNEVSYGNMIVGWRIKFDDPHKETLFRLKYSEYIK